MLARLQGCLGAFRGNFASCSGHKSKPRDPFRVQGGTPLGRTELVPRRSLSQDITEFFVFLFFCFVFFGETTRSQYACSAGPRTLHVEFLYEGPPSQFKNAVSTHHSDSAIYLYNLHVTGKYSVPPLLLPRPLSRRPAFADTLQLTIWLKSSLNAFVG